MGKREKKAKPKGPVIALPAARFGPRGFVGLAERLRIAGLLEREAAETKQAARRTDQFAPFETPAKAGNHVEINPTEPMEWRRFRALPGNHPLVKAWVNGKIDATQFNAGNIYRLLFEKANDTSGRDSTQALCVNRSYSGYGAHLRSAEAEQAKNSQARVERRIGSDIDRIIVRAFCGHGLSMAASVDGSGLRYNSNAVVHRVREALNALDKAIKKAGVGRGADDGAVAEFLRKTA